MQIGKVVKINRLDNQFYNKVGTVVRRHVPDNDYYLVSVTFTTDEIVDNVLNVTWPSTTNTTLAVYHSTDLEVINEA